jgi:hypothetical protein
MVMSTMSLFLGDLGHGPDREKLLGERVVAFEEDALLLPAFVELGDTVCFERAMPGNLNLADS